MPVTRVSYQLSLSVVKSHPGSISCALVSHVEHQGFREHQHKTRPLCGSSGEARVGCGHWGQGLPLKGRREENVSREKN